MADKPPPLLWHYTSFKGLHGILTEKVLFASGLAFLNDTEEFLYTINQVPPILEKLFPTYLGDMLNGLMFANVPSVVKAMFGHIRGQGNFVVCFSKEPDDLSQWRSYTPSPPGFALGFDPDELIKLANLHDFAVAECEYPRQEELSAEIEKALREATVGMDEERKALPPTGKAPDKLEAFVEKWTFKIVTAVVTLATYNKHPKFAAEKEVRLIGGAFTPEEERSIHYRLSGSLVVPYRMIPARPPEGPSPIKFILVGPCPHQEAVVLATQRMCNQHGVNARVIPSEVPFRNW